ncbi:uncharacterized protein LOC62_03G005064 [Vanrija pseudolonga]|uniref:Pentatricopeptide repeat domain-containing protein n=1 Tax=Vanrija pseudolonga TaxID=143232 RepID=A0AAF0Y7C3_9TREE|nr:hypothetical protein LOC62_03G005064 [Vanrija pseudolonga]
MASSANALYVLRLVINGGEGTLRTATALRRFSTAALSARDHAPTLSQSRAYAAAPSSSLAATPDFLEPDNEEYVGAEAFLPTRQGHPHAPIPWPTLFSHETGAKPAPARPCDLLARLVAENKLGPARKVHDELRALHTDILHREIYLSAAVSSLASTPEGRANFLFWMGLIPNRPATPATPVLKNTWHPIVYRLIGEHSEDLQFISNFLTLAGKKGLLPAVLPSLITPLVAICPPHVSERILESAIAAYLSVTVPKTSTSARADRNRTRATDQVTGFWNRYLRALAIAGWDESARALLFSPPKGISWSRFSRSVVLGQGLERRDTAAAARAEAEEENPFGILNRNNVPALAIGLRQALNSDQLPHVSRLADLQRQLLALPKRTSLIRRFRNRFTRPPSTPAGRSTPTMREVWWWHAEIVRLAQDGRPEDAIRVFREHFLWVGLPPTNVAKSDEPSYGFTRLVPSARINTSVLRSILALLPIDELSEYQQQYLRLARSTAPSLQPNEYTHLAFIREMTYRQGPVAGTTALHAIVEAGLDPGAPAWSALVLSLCGRGQVSGAIQVLDGMEKRAKIGDSGIRMPLPTARTYAGAIRLLMQNGHRTEAQALLVRLRDTLGSEEAGGRKRKIYASASEALKAKPAPVASAGNPSDELDRAHG